MNRQQQADHWNAQYRRHGIHVVGADEKATAEEHMQETLRGNDFFRAHLDPFIQRTGGKPEVLLDYGCGYGRYLVFLAHRAHDYVGVDIAENALVVARKIADKLNNARVISVEQVAEKPHGPVDLVFANVVLQHNDEAMFTDATGIIRRLHPRRLWFNEQSDPAQATPGCWGRSLERFRAAFPAYDLQETHRRKGLDGRWHSVFSGFHPRCLA